MIKDEGSVLIVGCDTYKDHFYLVKSRKESDTIRNYMSYVMTASGVEYCGGYRDLLVIHCSSGKVIEAFELLGIEYTKSNILEVRRRCL
tara:strand:- start:2971 stop:3237 length:267 start_codon:yes stop_codon:yes gene_type:complete